MTYQYSYFPRATERIGSALLDANVTAQLDTIARRGSGFQDEAVRQRVSDLLVRLGDAEVLAMPGLGAAEGDIRRAIIRTDYSNFHRRSAHALSLLNENRDLLHRWVAGEDVAPVVIDLDHERNKQVEDLFQVVVDNYLLPSYALVSQAYWSYLNDPIPMRALRQVERVAGEIRGRGSREMMIAILLLAGTHQGRELALNIMKLTDEQRLTETLDRIWNTSFDLTYTRVAVSAPLYGNVPQPVVFITTDKHLSTFMDTINPLGGGMTVSGAVLPLDSNEFEGLIKDDLYEKVQVLMLNSIQAVASAAAPAEQVATIRRHNSIKHITRLEALFTQREVDKGPAARIGDRL